MSRLGLGGTVGKGQIPRARLRLRLWVGVVLFLESWRAHGATPATGLPAECDTEEWRDLLEKTWIYCLDAAPWRCMHHPFFTDVTWERLAGSLPWTGTFCRQGVGAAAAIFLRDVEQRPDNILKVEALDAERVLLVFGSEHHVFLPLDFDFAPFPYSAMDLLPFRERTVQSMMELCDAALQTMLRAAIPWVPWLGLLRFWTEVGHEKYRDMAGAVTPDVLVPIEFEERLLQLRPVLKEMRAANPLQGLFMYEVAPHRLVQLSFNAIPELGDGIDLRHICPTCTVLSLYFFHKDGSLTTDAPPCYAEEDVFKALEVFRDFQLNNAAAGEMPQAALEMMWRYGGPYFAAQPDVRPGRPCSMEPSDFRAVDADAHLGEMSKALASTYTLLPEAFEVNEDQWAHQWSKWQVTESDEQAGAVQHVDSAEEASQRRLILPATDFSEHMDSLEGARGWFAYMELRLGAQNPALAIFHAKLYMKRLMMERGVPIPRILHGSLTSPVLPKMFGPPLLRMQGGYVVKPTHLAESHHVFVIDPNGLDLLTGTAPSFEEVQGNISLSWVKSLRDYDKQSSEDSDEACARSKRYAVYLENRSCTNWALYHCPPGVIVEEVASPSESYGALQNSAFMHQNLDVTWRRQPDEIKCYVIWGKLWVAEWVSSGAFLGFIFRHGFVKDTIAIGPRTLDKCWNEGSLPEGQVCEFEQTWEFVVGIAEKAVPPGVDFLRVDIFPNGGLPVVNEMTTASYSTLLEEWMLDEMMRRVKEGYKWRSFDD